MSRIDVLIYGAELGALIAAALFDKAGYSVRVIDEGRRLGGRHCFLPFSEKSLNSLEVVKGLEHVHGMMNNIELLLIKSFKAPLRSSLPIKIGVVDVSSLSDSLAASAGFDVSLWSDIREKSIRENSVSCRIKTPFGTESLTARLFIEAKPHRTGPSVIVATGTVKDPREGREHKLVIGDGLQLVLNHGSLSTVVAAGSKPSLKSQVALSEIQTEGLGITYDVPVLTVGETAGHVAPPWIGDFIVASAHATYRLGSAYLAGSYDRGALDVYVEVSSKAEQCKLTLKSVVEGSIYELPASHVNRALDPHWILEALDR